MIKFMVIFGGYYEVTKELNDLFLFDFVHHKWIEIFREVDSPISPQKLMNNALMGNSSKVLKETTSSVEARPYQDS